MSDHYHPIYSEIVTDSEMDGALFVYADNDHPSLRDCMLSLPDSDCAIAREYKKITGEWPATNKGVKPTRLIRTPRR